MVWLTCQKRLDRIYCVVYIGVLFIFYIYMYRNKDTKTAILQFIYSNNRIF